MSLSDLTTQLSKENLLLATPEKEPWTHIPAYDVASVSQTRDMIDDTSVFPAEFRNLDMSTLVAVLDQTYISSSDSRDVTIDWDKLKTLDIDMWKKLQ